MANMLFANNANTTLNSGITAIATSMVVTSATGFPVPTGSQYFYCTLADAATQTTIEIVKVTAVSGTTFTIVRGQDGTSGTAFSSGAVVSLRLVAASLNDFPKLDEANTFTYAPTFSTALAVGSGGTGLTSLTAGYIPYGNGTSAFSSSANLAFDGTNLVVAGKITGNVIQNSQVDIVVVTNTTVKTFTASGVEQWFCIASDLNASTTYAIGIVTTIGGSSYTVINIAQGGDYLAGWNMSGANIRLTSVGGGSNCRASFIRLR